MNISNVTPMRPAFKFEASPKHENPILVRLALAIIEQSYSSSGYDFVGKDIANLTEGKKTFFNFLSPLMSFIKKTLDLPLSDHELAKKIKEFVKDNPTIGAGLSSKQIEALSKNIFGAIKNLKGSKQLHGKVNPNFPTSLDLKHFFLDIS